MKAHVIGNSHGHSLNECIVMSYDLLPPVNHHQQADLFSCHNYNDRLTGQSEVKCKLHHKPVECLECRNSKSDHLKLHTLGCKYLWFHKVNGPETGNSFV